MGSQPDNSDRSANQHWERHSPRSTPATREPLTHATCTTAREHLGVAESSSDSDHWVFHTTVNSWRLFFCCPLSDSTSTTAGSLGAGVSEILLHCISCSFKCVCTHHPAALVAQLILIASPEALRISNQLNRESLSSHLITSDQSTIERV